jgi:hypothetical protein
MNKKNTYISYVIQEEDKHIHSSEILSFPPPSFAVYSDNTAHQVLKWAEKKQESLHPSQQVVILNYFNIENID